MAGTVLGCWHLSPTPAKIAEHLKLSGLEHIGISYGDSLNHTVLKCIPNVVMWEFLKMS